MKKTNEEIIKSFQETLNADGRKEAILAKFKDKSDEAFGFVWEMGLTDALLHGVIGMGQWAELVVMTPWKDAPAA